MQVDSDRVDRLPGPAPLLTLGPELAEVGCFLGVFSLQAGRLDRLQRRPFTT